MSRVVVFTLCSANYLAQAKTLGDSLLEHNPDYQFVIGLVDRVPPNLSSAYWQPHELIAVEDLGIPEFGEMAGRYNLVELNTAVKPFYMEYLYRRDARVDCVIYLDPDIMVVDALTSLQDELQRSSIVLTPHSCSYTDADETFLWERGMLTTGTFNLGFIATARTPDTMAFLDWWKKRLRRYCNYWPGHGRFVDQYWVNLAPVFFRGVHVEKDPGYNMAYWNLFERSLSQQDGRYVVNGQHRLLFYHFSSYSPMKPDMVTTRTPETKMTEHPELRSLFEVYRGRLLRNQYEALLPLEYAFAPKAPPAEKRNLQNGCKTVGKALYRRLLSLLPKFVRNMLRRMGEFFADTTIP